MVPPTNKPTSNVNISSGRDNEEMIKRSIRKSKRKYFRVTYNLANAKLAMQSQVEEKSAFDKFFISLGSFQLEMNFSLLWEELLKKQVVPIF